MEIDYSRGIPIKFILLFFDSLLQGNSYQKRDGDEPSVEFSI